MIELCILDIVICVVDRVSLILKEGEVYVLVGELGLGKSFIVKVIVGVLNKCWYIMVDCMYWCGVDLMCLLNE